MSLVDYYELEILLLDKTQSTPTPITQGLIQSGDLSEWRHRIELVNAGNSKTDNGVVTLRIPTDGTFVRKEPILIDENAKDEYIIQCKINQPDGQGGVKSGKLFRFTIGRHTIQDDPQSGETLRLQLIPMEYRLKEHIQSEQLFFLTPQEAFQRRVLRYNQTKGSNEPALLYSLQNIDLPDNETLKQNYEPNSPTKTHDLLKEIIERLAEPPVAGGTFTDYYFETEAEPLDTKIVNIKAEPFGENSTGIIINPLSINSEDTEKDKTINLDLVEFKNNVILQGSARGGTLPMEKSKFSSNFEHAKLRPEWTVSTNYYDGTGTNGTSYVRFEFNIAGYTRFFKCIQSHTSDASITHPLSGSAKEDYWLEDFTIIPPWSYDAEYYKGGESSNQKQRQPKSVVSYDYGNTTYFYAVNDLASTEVIAKNGSPPPQSGNTTWALLNSFPKGDGGVSWGRVPFYSYTPWTSDYPIQVSNLSSSKYGTQPTGYVGLVPDWNFVRANFDRSKADDQFETISLKYINRVVGNLVTANPADIPTNELFNGARFLVNGSGIGDWSSSNVGYDPINRIAEWYQPAGDPTGEWKFSKQPTSSSYEAVSDLNTGQIHAWTGTYWQLGEWFLGNSGTNADVLSGNTKGNVTSPFHAVKEIKLTTGSTGIAGQAIRLKFNWNYIYTNLTNYGDVRNMSSRGAWWCQFLPMPRIDDVISLNGNDLGDVFSKSTLDVRNMDSNRNGVYGWNNGLDSEDLGRINAISFKVRLTVEDSNNILIGGLSNMPMTAWAVDIFDRIWFTPFSIRRNGQYDFIRIGFGENAPQQLHHNRIDELFTAYGYTFSQNFFLNEKEFSGIEFDWRYVRCWGMFWNITYDDNGMYIGVRDAIQQTIGGWLAQVGNYGMSNLSSNLTLGQYNTAQSLIIDHAYLDIDELAFEKQLFVNSDDTANPNARTKMESMSMESDYLNLKSRAIAIKERSKFINQSWFMKAHGDVSMKFGESFIAIGSRVPFQTYNFDTWSVSTTYSSNEMKSYGGYVWRSLKNNNVGNQPNTNPSYWENVNELVCAEVKHIIDSDGYMMEFTGIRKFRLVD